MITQRTIIDQIEVTRSGHIQLRLAKLVERDGTEISKEYHRTMIEPGGDVDAQMALVNDHLQRMGCEPCEPDDRVKKIVQMVHTPELIEKH